MKQKELFEIKESKIKKERFIFKRIRDENFDFSEVPASTGVYGIHPYPAMFHFLVVRKLLELYSKKKDIVWDPFMGSGVVGVECLISGRNFIGYDINPLAVLITKVRVTPLSQKLFLRVFSKLEEEFKQMKPEKVDFFNINYWFKKEVIDELSKLRKIIYNIKDENFRNFFIVSFSETVRRVANIKYSEFKLLRKENGNKNVFNVFRQIVFRNINLLTNFYKENKPQEIKILVENRNVLHEVNIKDESIDLVITSPPYGDSKTTVAYGQFSRLPLQWLGIKEKVDKESLGSKRREIKENLPSDVLYEFLYKIREKDEKRAREVYSFYYDLYNAISIISKKVKKDKYVCFVVGNRRVKGIQLPTDKICADFFENFGFRHEKTIIRGIFNKRMPSLTSPTNIKGKKEETMKYEYIVILQKK